MIDFKNVSRFFILMSSLANKLHNFFLIKNIFIEFI